MGQYYNPAIIDKKGKVLAWAYSHDYNNGLKLMEHSWLGNNFVSGFEALLTKGGQFHKQKVVWAGDYADPENGNVDTGDTIYSRCEDGAKQFLAQQISDAEFRFIVNYDKKQFVDKQHVPSIKPDWDDSAWAIHPLPLLTCEGNGRGGGDFRGDDPNNLIGSWARDRIGIETQAPKGFTELTFDLTE